MVLVGPAGEEASYAIEGIGAPDLDTVDWLATAQLCALRRGARIEVRDATPALLDLLDLAGLRRQMCREAEDLEEPGVQEGVEPGDPPL